MAGENDPPIVALLEPVDERPAVREELHVHLERAVVQLYWHPHLATRFKHTGHVTAPTKSDRMCGAERSRLAPISFGSMFGIQTIRPSNK